MGGGSRIFAGVHRTLPVGGGPRGYIGYLALLLFAGVCGIFSGSGFDFLITHSHTQPAQEDEDGPGPSQRTSYATPTWLCRMGWQGCLAGSAGRLGWLAGRTRMDVGSGWMARQVGWLAWWAGLVTRVGWRARWVWRAGWSEGMDLRSKECSRVKLGCTAYVGC